MNRSALKSLGILLLGVVMGWGLGRSPRLGGGAGAESGRPSGAGAQSGSSDRHGAAQAIPKGEAVAGKAGGKSDGDRVETLALQFRTRRGKIAAGEERTAFLSMMMGIQSLSAGEIAALMAFLPEEEMDREAAKLLAVRWAMLDPGAALAFAIGDSKLRHDGQVLSSIIRELAKVDLPAAKAALPQLGESERIDAGSAITGVLQERDPRGALAYARELKNETAEAGAISRMAETDPVAAAAELTPGRENQKALMEEIAAAMLNRDRKEYDAWAAGLKDPARRAVARQAALDRDADADPKAAALEMAAWLAKDPEASPHIRDLSGELAVRWGDAGAQPAELAAWALTLPHGRGRNSAVAAVSSIWLEKDTMAASIWLRSLPQGGDRDGAVLRMVRKISRETPNDAFEWARTIENQVLRKEALRQSVGNWAGQDPATAQQAVETLPAEDRGYLRDTLEAAKEEREKAKEKE